jgi:uncharacterized protein (DUF983 family)
METDNKPPKCCSRCKITKEFHLFIKNRNICRQCNNSRKKFLNDNRTYKEGEEKCCNTCEKTKAVELFMKNRNICKDCNNQIRRNKFAENEDLRKRTQQKKSDAQRKKRLERQDRKRQRQLEIGEGNKQCRYCESIFPKTNFRHNRLKCIDCERWENREGIYIKAKFDNSPENVRVRMKRLKDPIFKFICTQRSRIHNVLKQNKTKNTIEYLGCNSEQFYDWMNYQFKLNKNENFTFENHGTFWHIDHVIPISRFDLENKEHQLLSLNWRNTMPLSVQENLSKNNKIIESQLQQHYQTLLSYHKEKNIDFPQEFINLYVQHDQIAGNPLEL